MPSDGLSKSPRKIMMVAAETSSCLYAKRLLEYWKKHNVSLEAFGIGDQSMADEGFECLARAEDLAVVGIQEVIAHFPVIRTAFHRLLEEAEKRQPAVVLLLDYPDFNLRLAKKLKALGLPVVYYISPQVWAWRQGRVKIIEKYIAKLLVVFPFEVEFYQKHAVPVEFVGHPLLDELEARQDTEAGRQFQRAKYGLTPGDVLLALMPGSRRSEIKHHLETQLQAARILVQRHPRLKVALFVAPNFNLDLVRTWLERLDFPLVLIKDEPFSMINLADVVLCASGTATLMVGLLEKPMVVMYRMNPISAFLAKVFVKNTAHFGLINLVLNERVVPELFQGDARAECLVEQLEPLIADEKLRHQIAARLRPAKDRLGSTGATARVALALEPYWS